MIPRVNRSSKEGAKELVQSRAELVSVRMPHAEVPGGTVDSGSTTSQAIRASTPQIALPSS